jgi:hypothetical protein
MSLYRRTTRAVALVSALAVAALAGATDPPGQQPKDDGKKFGDKVEQAEKDPKAEADRDAKKLARLAAHPFWAGKQTKEGIAKVIDKLLQVDFDKDAEYALVLADGTVKPFPKPAGRLWPINTQDAPRVPDQALVRVAAGKRLSREELVDELIGGLCFVPTPKKK